MYSLLKDDVPLCVTMLANPGNQRPDQNNGAGVMYNHRSRLRPTINPNLKITIKVNQ